MSSIRWLSRRRKLPLNLDLPRMRLMLRLSQWERRSVSGDCDLLSIGSWERRVFWQLQLPKLIPRKIWWLSQQQNFLLRPSLALVSLIILLFLPRQGRRQNLRWIRAAGLQPPDGGCYIQDRSGETEGPSPWRGRDEETPLDPSYFTITNVDNEWYCDR